MILKGKYKKENNNNNNKKGLLQAMLGPQTVHLILDTHNVQSNF